MIRLPPIAIVLSLGLTACATIASSMMQPLDQAVNRPMPLNFGLHVTTDPAENPIDPPEAFAGYHAAIDYEVSAEELDAEVPVYAICGGEVVYSGFAEGYGGLLVHRCRIRSQMVTVLYGHLVREGLPKVGETVTAGQKIAILAPARSPDSGGNRKHLHLGIHRGRGVDIRGYVQSEEELEDYMNPADVLPMVGLEGILPNMRAYWDTGSGSMAD